MLTSASLSLIAIVLCVMPEYGASILASIPSLSGTNLQRPKGRNRSTPSWTPVSSLTSKYILMAFSAIAQPVDPKSPWTEP